MAHQAALKRHGILISMSGKGNCFDNSGGKTFIKTLKFELTWHTVFQTTAEAKKAGGRYIEDFYSPVRQRSTSSVPFSSIESGVR
jgi:putative transposase